MFFDVTLPKLPESKACAEIGGLVENNSFSKNFNLTCMPTTSSNVGV
jgi:hypothetical protein